MAMDGELKWEVEIPRSTLTTGGNLDRKSPSQGYLGTSRYKDQRGTR
jgi:hypothetical protein